MAAVAVSREGVGALAIAYTTANGHASGIRLIDKAGKEVRFVESGRYVPMQLAFAKHGDLWSIGWERDQWINDTESKDNYNIVRKYSPQGALLGEFLPRSLWATKRGPHLGGRGYWTMCAADDRVGAIFNENFSGATPEWVEWDLNGVLLRRIPLGGVQRLQSRAFDGRGRLYAQFPGEGDASELELRNLDTGNGRWVPVRANLPDRMSAFLLGADGDQLVYRVRGGGNVHLVWARPE